MSGPIAAPAASTIVAGGGQSGVVVSIDGGLTWSSASFPAQATSFYVDYIGFTTATQGVLITSDSGGRSQLLMTRDGGNTWLTTRF